MSKRTVFTTLTPLPAGISRETVLETLHSHVEMIDLNPLVEERHPIKPPPTATPEEYHCTWYSLTDRVQYLPGGIMSGKVSYNACFHDLDMGLQTHVYAPLGLNIRGKWTLGGSLPGEPVAPVEIGLGVPLQGLYLREDVDMRCNIMMTSFVKKTLKKAHAQLVGRLLIKSQIVDASKHNEQINNLGYTGGRNLGSQASTEYLPATDYDSQTLTESLTEDSRFSNTYAALSPPPHSNSFRRDDHSGSRGGDEKGDSLYPKALSIRSSSPSWNGSMNGSQNGRAPHQDSALPNQRVSWQNLTTARSNPSIRQGNSTSQNPGMHPQLPQYNPAQYAQYQRQEERPDSRHRLPQSGYAPPPSYGPVELE
jgi:hypothetical protein